MVFPSKPCYNNTDLLMKGAYTMKPVSERFLTYVKHLTTSDEDSTTFPSTKTQLDFAAFLAEECKAIGLQDVSVDEYGYVTASLPGTVKNVPVIGFIAHMDTSPDASCENIHPNIVENYDGKNVLLNEEKDIWLSVEDFPELSELVGQDLIVTDGTTLLGADDKAGVAEIMTMTEYLLAHPEVEHGKICIAFTPDEEIGCGTKYFDIKKFGALYAYTVDGGALGELGYENFNVAQAMVHICGRNIHPETAKGKMKNALLIAQELQSLIPVQQNPMHTEGCEGFFHLERLNGTEEEAEMEYFIRDYDSVSFEQKKRVFLDVTWFLREKYGSRTVVATTKDYYYNMKDILILREF